jgi:hypothetical protein
MIYLIFNDNFKNHSQVLKKIENKFTIILCKLIKRACLLNHISSRLQDFNYYISIIHPGKWDFFYRSITHNPVVLGLIVMVIVY